ncbi:hypothetical protein CJ030_MR8G002390 [Morella rubra]|uniref:Uncharacterized protein n=1 Tax=Morella rubra TaxID=262757 RepID=A0A6A1UPH1_9ROSI|nr:hypothetical protein CJ030_MR8G002390 [Morella rubra]
MSFETSRDDNQCKIMTRTSGVARSAEPICEPTNFEAPWVENRQDIPRNMETTVRISRTGCGRGCSVSNAVYKEEPALPPRATFDSVDCGI